MLQFLVMDFSSNTHRSNPSVGSPVLFPLGTGFAAISWRPIDRIPSDTITTPPQNPKKNGLLSGVSHFFIGCWHFKTQDIWGQDLITNLTIWFKNNSWIILDHFGRIIGVRSFDLALFHPPSGFINALKLVPQLMFEEVTSQQASFGALL